MPGGVGRRRIAPDERHNRETSTFLAYRDDGGQFISFHSLRHTFVSNSASGGGAPKVAQRLARHSTAALTLERYTHLYEGDLAGALNVLPDLSTPVRRVAARTGTNDETCASARAVNLLLNGATPQGV